jgi:hypothetical protein
VTKQVPIGWHQFEQTPAGVVGSPQIAATTLPIVASCQLAETVCCVRVPLCNWVADINPASGSVTKQASLGWHRFEQTPAGIVGSPQIAATTLPIVAS